MHHARYYDDDEPQHLGTSSSRNSEISADGIQPASDGTSAQSVHEHALAQHDGIVEVDMEPTVRSRLLNHQNWDAASGCGDANCSHGDTSPRPGNPRNYGSFAGSIRSVASFGAYPGTTEPSEGDAPDATHALLGDAVANGNPDTAKGFKMSTTRWLAERHGVKNQRMM
jgi:hypothetical protein